MLWLQLTRTTAWNRGVQVHLPCCRSAHAMVPLTRDELLEVGAAEELLRHQVVATHGWLLFVL